MRNNIIELLKYQNILISNNNKIVIELYIDDGFEKPFFCILNTPDTGNVIRIVNTSPIEFPLIASVTPNSMNRDTMDPIMG